METQISSLLLNKWKNQTLGHFYIVRGGSKESSNWIEGFLSKIIPKGTNPHNHPDILFLTKDPEKKSFSWENDFNELFKFLKFAPLTLYKKIVIVFDSQFLTQDISNKILRTLEDSKDTVFFFLNPTQTPLLPTIESRAITLRIKDSSTENYSVNLYSSSQFQSWLESQKEENLPKFLGNFKEIQNLLDELKNDKEMQNKVFDLLLAWEVDHLSDFKHKEHFLEEIKRFQLSLTYNNPYKERFVSLLSSCQVN